MRPGRGTVRVPPPGRSVTERIIFDYFHWLFARSLPPVQACFSGPRAPDPVDRLENRDIRVGRRSRSSGWLDSPFSTADARGWIR